MTCQLGSFNYQSNIPSWNIRCVPRSRLKLVSRERKMMMLMLSRKMLMLRRRMLRRKTDEARTQTYTLREPEQSKCISTCPKSRTIRKFTGNTPQTRVRSTQIRHAFTPTVRTPQCGQNCLGNQKTDCNCLQACHFWTSGPVAGPGTRAPGHNPIHGHTGTRAQPRSTGTRAKPTREPTSLRLYV